MRSRLRFVVALGLAAVLGGWLLYTSMAGSMETYSSPSALASMAPGSTVRLDGIVDEGLPTDPPSAAQSPAGLTFTIHDKGNPKSTVRVLYRGKVTDTFKVGREVVITGTQSDGTFVARRDSMLTLCPSKFNAKQSS
ncbi:MAG: cytochrome c maturation protein CcmE [Thermoleophilia bacterium]